MDDFEAAARALDGVPAAPVEDGDHGRDDRDWPLEDNCPVVPLGVNAGRFYYLDANKQLRDLTAKDHGRNVLMSLFGRYTGYPWKAWPRFAKDGKTPTGWRPEVCADTFMQACAMKGVWNPNDKVRGAGAWRDDHGELVLHCGDRVLVGQRWIEPGVHGKHVYTADEAGLKPDVNGTRRDAQRLYELLQTWNWRRGDLDAYLACCWIGAAMIGGALRWRPLIWITGDRGTGKSTLHELFEAVFGSFLVHASDATGAGIWQKLGYSTRPVTLDELEAEEDDRRAQSIIKLARQASSGGVVLRGGSDHSGAEFVARSCFMFSSILVPPLKTQDRSRMAILELDELGKGAEQPVIDAVTWSALGRRLLGLLARRWGRFDQTLDIFRHALAQVGHGGRGADQFGTLLAVGDLMFGDDSLPDSDSIAEWVDQLKAGDLAEKRGEVADHESCLDHLLGSVLDLDKHKNKRSVASWVDVAANAMCVDNDLLADVSLRSDVNRMLQSWGLAVVTRGKGADERRYLAVAISHQGLAQVFSGSHWSSRSGTAGVWAQALARIRGAVACQTVKMAKRPVRATLIPLDEVLQEDDDE